MKWNIAAENKNLINSPEDLKNQLLINRGLIKKSKIENFLNPNLEDYFQDFELEGISKAKIRINKAIKDQELIIIYGDYDVDGVCSTAILYHSLNSLGAKVLPYIPHREKEGYGLSEFGIKSVFDKGARIIITVDNGIVALEQAKLCRELGIDLIITDHHETNGELPKALAIIHSTKFCGAGVAWCLARKLISDSDSLLELVAIATICDLIPLTGVNRALVKFGILKLKNTENLGIKALVLDSELNLSNINAYQISHVIGPKLNAIGRLENAMDALRLLCTQSPSQARNLSAKLSLVNDQKKKITADAISEARIMIKETLKDEEEKSVFILSSENWIPGVIGLIAGRISDEYKTPTIVISKGEVYSKGSARSNNGVSIVEMIRACSDCLLDVGGHIHAAGFTLETARIEEFNNRINLASVTKEVRIEEFLEIDGVLNSKNIDFSWIDILNQFEPFGLENPKPIFISKRVKAFNIKSVGNGQHLKFQADGVEAIAFSFGNLATTIRDGDLIDLAYHLEEDNFRGNTRLQFKVLDIKV